MEKEPPATALATTCKRSCTGNCPGSHPAGCSLTAQPFKPHLEKLGGGNSGTSTGRGHMVCEPFLLKKLIRATALQIYQLFIRRY